MLSYYLKIIKKLVIDYSNPILRKARGKNTSITVWKFGELNPDKIIYFITDMSSEGSGIFSMYIGILEHLLAAKNMGWVPVIDDTAALFRRSKHKFRKNKNVMNELFEFNNEMTVQDVLQSSNVIISSITDLRFLKNIPFNECIVKQKTFFDYTIEELKYWRKFSYDNLPYKSNIQIELDTLYYQLLGSKKSVLGVAVREGKMGMNTKGISASGEFEQPSIEKIIEKTRTYYEKWQCDYIYLSCETEKTIEMFQQVFGVELIGYVDRMRIDYDKIINVTSMKQGVKMYSKNPELQKNYRKFDMDYIKDMYILSKCDFCIMPVNCGTEVAYLKNENLKDSYIMKSY